MENKLMDIIQKMLTTISESDLSDPVTQDELVGNAADFINVIVKQD